MGGAINFYRRQTPSIDYIYSMKHMKKYMHRPHPLLLAAVVAVVAAAVASVIFGKKYMRKGKIPMLKDFKLTSPAFEAGSAIPEKYTCEGANVSPPLKMSGAPDVAISLALVLHDPDAPDGDYLHWTMWNINPNATVIAENKVPVGAMQGKNDAGSEGYTGPCPPSGTGTHHYVFDMYVLSSILNLPAGASRQEVMQAIRMHAIGKTQLTGTFSAE